MGFLINALIILIIALFIYQRIIPAKGVNQMDVQQLKKILRNKAYQFVDVRTPYEFNANHIEGFINIPLHEIRRRHHELSKEKAVVVICQSGMRSNRAAKILKKLGFTNIANVKGGMALWRSI